MRNKGKTYPIELYPDYGMRGKHLSMEHGEKIGLANRGRKGKTYPIELYPNFGGRGKPHSEKTRKKISIAKKGTPSWNKGLTKETDERVAKIGTTLKGKKFSDEHKKKLRKPKSEEHRRKLSLTRKGKKYPKLSEAMKGKHPSAETKKRNSIKSKQLWQIPEYREKVVRNVMKANHLKPNQPEQIIDGLIQTHHLPFLYIGDGSKIINGRCPDFTHNNGQKKVILCNGIYWHLLRRQKDIPNLTKVEVESIERKPYEDMDYKVLFVWEDELENQNQVLEKIFDFVGR